MFESAVRRNVFREHPAAAAFVIACAFSLTSFARNPSSISPSCPFDGHFYCAAANGERIIAPFSRRPVVPAIARHLPGTFDERFRAIAVVSLVLAIALAVVLGDRLARQLGAHRRARIASASIIGAAILSAPHGLRLAWSVPVLVDEAALATGLLWMVLFTSRSRTAQMLAVPAAFLACCTREIWGPVIVLSALTVVFVRPKNRTLALANVAVAAFAFVLVTRLIPSVPTQMFGPHGYDEIAMTRSVWHLHFGNLRALRQTTWSVVFAVGLLPAILLLRPPVSFVRRQLVDGDVTGFTLLLTGILLIGSAPVSGTDVTRYAYIGGIVMIAFGAPWLAAHRDLAAPGAVLAIATIALWEPTRHLITSIPDYRAYYYPASRANIGLTISAVAIGATVEMLLLRPRAAHRTEIEPSRYAPAGVRPGIASASGRR